MAWGSQSPLGAHFTGCPAWRKSELEDTGGPVSREPLLLGRARGCSLVTIRASGCLCVCSADWVDRHSQKHAFLGDSGSSRC